MDKFKLFLKRILRFMQWIGLGFLILTILAVSCTESNNEISTNSPSNSKNVDEDGNAPHDVGNNKEVNAKPEREAKEKAEREAKEKVEREAKEKAENETKERARIKALRQPPEDQVRFYMIVSEAQNQYKSGENAMAKGAARFKRAQELCKLFQNKSIVGWIGVVNQLSSNQEGRGVLSISFGNDVQLTTWNNIVSDSGSNTLIDPRSELFNQVVGLSLGSWVKFDGSFFENKTDCIREKNLTLEGSILKPEYIFKFKKISLID